MQSGIKVVGITKEVLDLMVHFECSGNVKKYLKAYQDIAGIWTIGIGTTFYPDTGKKVKQGDICTVEQAYKWKEMHLNTLIKVVDSLTVDSINQGMMNSLVDFAYNAGEGNYRTSTLRKVINKNPFDYVNIEQQIMDWTEYKDPKTKKYKHSPGLERRRKCEFYLYKNGVNHPTFFE